MKLTLQSVNKLVRACEKSNVAIELKFGDYYLKLQPPVIVEKSHASPAAIPERKIISQDNSGTDSVFIEEQVLDAEEDESLMILNDPEGYENRLAAGEMMDGEKVND